MAAYFIVNVEIKDAEKLKPYMEAAPAIFKKYGGKFLARGGDLEVLEGDWNPKRLILVEFESRDQAMAFFNSKDYQAVIATRHSAAITDWVLAEGLSPEMAQTLNG